MGGSRRKYKRSRAKVQVGLPKKKPGVFKPAFSLPPKLLHSLADKDSKWDDEGSVIQNYKSFGVVSNPNLLGVRSRTPHIVESDSLNVPLPPAATDEAAIDQELMDSGSDLEEDGQSVASFYYFIFSLFFQSAVRAFSPYICPFAASRSYMIIIVFYIVD